ncbi:MAG: MarR family transcriptional regulator [Pirellulales bacterium]
MIEDSTQGMIELPMALRAAYMAMHRRTDNALAKHGVTADQFVLMATLSRGHAMTQRDLARRISSDPSTVRAMLVLLEKQGYIQRETNPDDSRALLVKLTATGKRKFKTLWKVSDEIRQQLFESIPFTTCKS